MFIEEAPCLQEAVRLAAAAGVPVWFEPVSVPKARRAVGALHLLEHISPNAAELIAISEALAQDTETPAQRKGEQAHTGLLPATAGRKRVIELQYHIKRVLDAGAKNIVLTLGVDGAALCTLGYADLSPLSCLPLPAILSTCPAAHAC